MNTPVVVLNAAEIKATNEELEKWTNENTQLYGPIVHPGDLCYVSTLFISTFRMRPSV